MVQPLEAGIPKTMIKTGLLSIFRHQTLYLVRWDLHFMWIRFTNMLLLRERRLHKKLEHAKHPLYLNLGSGPRGIASESWLNVDGYVDTNVDYSIDFNRKLPFPNDCFDGIFCEHVLEHFKMADAQKLLGECFRVLTPGGCIRIIVPDGEKIVKTYLENPRDLLTKRDCVSSCAMEAVNSYFRQQYEHQIAFDDSLLKYQMTIVGFVDVDRMDYSEGRSSTPLAIDDERGDDPVLYEEYKDRVNDMRLFTGIKA
jgi:predicted SAM-dependent methyltransferase